MPRLLTRRSSPAWRGPQSQPPTPLQLRQGHQRRHRPSSPGARRPHWHAHRLEELVPHEVAPGLDRSWADSTPGSAAQPALAADGGACKHLVPPRLKRSRWALGVEMKAETKLYFMCGKMAAGKSTYAKQLARDHHALLLVQDELVAALFPGEMQDIPSFVKYSGRLKDALSNSICDLLSLGVSVVLDFPGNTRNQRRWFRDLFERSKVEHELHYIDASDDLCKRQLRQRSEALPAGSAWTTDAEFDLITAYFQAPADDEHFNVVRRERA